MAGIFDRIGGKSNDQEIMRPRTGLFQGSNLAARDRQAEVINRVVNEERQALMQGQDSIDLREAMPKAYFNAARRIGDLGNANAAAMLYEQGLKAQSEYESQQANLGKLRSETTENYATAENQLAEVDDLKEPILRLQMRRRTLSKELSELPPGPTSNQRAVEIDDINDMIAKLTTIVGRTEQDVGRATQTNLEDMMIDLQAQADAIAQWSGTFDPAFYTLGGRAKGAWLKAQDIMSDSMLGPQEKTELIQRTENLQAMSDQYSAYINMVTGAAIGQGEEIKRLSDARFNRDDGPTVMASKAAVQAWMIPAIQARARAAVQAKDMSIIAQPLTQWAATPPPWEARAGRPDPATASIEQLIEYAKTLKPANGETN
jgi:hypothetical protein